MAYAKTAWVDDAAPAVSASNLNKIEQGIYDAHADIATLQDTVDNLGPALPTTAAETANYTAVLTDAENIVEMNSASAVTFTIPPNSAVAFPVGTTITVLQTGAGQVTVAAGAGVTLNATPGLKIAAQWGAVTLLKRGTDLWVAFGNLVA